MKTCKDCLHYEACSVYADDVSGGYSWETEWCEECERFKDKNTFFPEGLTMDNSTCSKKEQIRLIDAIEFLADLKARHDYVMADEAVSKTHKWYEAIWNNAIVNAVEKQPTIDPESLRPTAEWIDIYGGKYANPRYACSACGEKALYKFEADALDHVKAVQALSKSCPNCGAKMKGADNHA